MAGKLQGPAIGIDLGTTYCCAGIWQNDRVEIIVNGQGNRTTPSCVAFTDFERLFGEAAENQCNTNPKNTVFGAKRLIGRRFKDPYVQNYMQHCPYKVIAGPQDKPIIVVNYLGEKKRFTAEEISSIILDNMRHSAELYIGKEVENAVVTVPAYFNNSQRRATRNAGRIAGLNILRIINEPTAAAIAYGINNVTDVNDKNILVFDLGGGTFDVSLLNIKGGHLKVKATAGDTNLGGEDFNNRMVNYFVEEFKRNHGKDICENAKALRRLRTACEKAKRILSFAMETNIELDCLLDGIDFQAKITRAGFEELNLDLFTKCIDIVAKCLWGVNMKKKNVHDVVLVGGSTRIPKLEELLQEFFHDIKLSKSINPDEVVACGATMLAANLVGNGSKKIQDLFLHDVTPLSLGTDKIGGVMSVLIPRNTPIPVRKQCVFKTVRDNQSCIGVGIYEGERELVDDNNFLGEFDLDCIPPAPAGVQKIFVTFEVDVDGVLTVSAQLGANGPKNEITITEEKSKSGSEETDRIANEAIVHNDGDKERREKVESESQLRHLLHNLKIRISTGVMTHNLKDSNRMILKDAIEGASNWLETHKSASAHEIEEKRIELEHIWSDISNRKKWWWSKSKQWI